MLWLAILNLIDGLLTFFEVKFNIASEFNPLMDFLIQKSLYLFLSVKVLFSLFLVSLGNADRFKWLINSVIFIYVILILWHVNGILEIL